MPATKREELPIRSEGDIVLVRQAVRAWAQELRFSLVEQTKLVTAASEIARNTFTHGGGGSVIMEILSEGRHTGLQLTFQDKGPGMADVDVALADGYSSIGGLGLGLGGAKRLVNRFSVQSKPGEGTQVILARWK